MSKLHQTLFGNKNRCAGNDYFEVNLKVNNWDELLTSDESNKLAIDNEKYFNRRFKFDAPREQRAAVINTKKILDLTDKEITNLKKSGLLTLTKSKYTFIYADVLILILGIMSILSCFIISILLFINFEYLSSVYFDWLIAIIFMLGYSSILIWLSNQYCFKPITIIRKCGIQLGNKLCIKSGNI